MQTSFFSCSHSLDCGRTGNKQGRIKEDRLTLPLGIKEGAEVGSCECKKAGTWSLIGISSVGFSLQAAFGISPGRTPKNQIGPVSSLYLMVLSFYLDCSSSRLEVFSGYT